MIVDIRDKVVVITGASKGIGREMARSFSREGACVVVNYNNSENLAQLLINEIQQYNHNCLLVKADITNELEVKSLYKAVISKYGKIDVLINNAGICNDSFSTVMQYDIWKQVISVNLSGVFLCSKIFSREMIAQNYGKIINISSYKGQIGSEGQVNYCASKAGVIGLTKSLAKELGHFNISVNAVCPTFINTSLNSDTTQKNRTAAMMKVMLADSSEDLFRFMIYLSSDMMRGVSGQIFNIDSRMI